MENKIIEKFIFQGFGFPILLHNVVVDQYNELELQTVKALIKSSKALNGAQLQFLRKHMEKYLSHLHSQDTGQVSDEGPFDPYKEELK